MDDGDTIDMLNNLIETAKDDEYGFARCAALAQDRRLGHFFSRVVVRGARAAEAGGSAGGALHRGWLGLKRRFAADSDRVLLHECLRSQASAAQRYRDALDDALPTRLRIALEQQYDGLLRHRGRVRALYEDSAALARVRAPGRPPARRACASSQAAPPQGLDRAR
jgi:uncharacterized protein (TIGR02284 family)